MLCIDFFLKNNSDESFCIYKSETYLSFFKMALRESKEKNIYVTFVSDNNFVEKKGVE